ncbi:MAG TPA: transcription termination factor NusA [Gemmataceae bacterium]|nr:transcription termination factor NusA [Gemmataceae bacterium]
MMNPTELLRGVEAIQREKNISKEIIFEAIESAVQLATEKFYGEEEEVIVTLDRDSGVIHARRGEEVIDPQELGRIAAQAAKQAMIQKLREGECNAVFNIYAAKKGDLVHGTVQRFEGGAATVTIDRSETLLPRSEQIPGETHHVGERVKAIILDVRKVGHRVKIILSRTHPDFVRRLFEMEIPEIADRTIEIKAVAREAGYRSKVAVSSIDLKVDCVGACVGVRGSRIKNIVDELGGERIDIVRWNDSLQVLIPNSLQPASVEEVFLYPRLGRAIVLVKEDQLSLAIGRRGQNVRLASKLVGWDIEIMTHDELTEGIERATNWFLQIPDVTDEMVEAFIEEGFLSYDDLTFLEPAQLGELAGISEEAADDVIAFAEEAAEQVEEEQKAAHAEGGGDGRKPKAAATPTPQEGARQAFESLFASPPTQEANATATEEAPAVAQEGAPSEAVEGVSAEAPPPEADVAVSAEVAPDAEAGTEAVPEPPAAEPGPIPEEKPGDQTLMSAEP